MSNQNASSVPNELFTRYASNDPIYSLFNNDYGMDLAWNYIPHGLDAYVNFTRDYAFDTGNTCHNIFSFGEPHRNVLRDICSIIDVDERHFAYRERNSNTISYVPFVINLIHSIPSFDGSQVSWTDNMSLDAVSNLEAVPVTALNFTPSIFSCSVLYTVDLYSNSMIDLHDFFTKKLGGSFALEEERAMLTDAPPVPSQNKPQSIFSYDREPIDLKTQYQPRSNQKKINFYPYGDNIIYDLLSILHPDYSQNASWLMHPMTLRAMRLNHPNQCQITQIEGRDHLCGKPVYLSVLMPYSKHEVLFGDFKAAFAVLDFGDLEARDMTAEEQLSYLPPQYARYHDSVMRVFLYRKKVSLLFLDENAMILSASGEDNQPPNIPVPPDPIDPCAKPEPHVAAHLCPECSKK